MLRNGFACDAPDDISSGRESPVDPNSHNVRLLVPFRDMPGFPIGGGTPSPC